MAIACQLILRLLIKNKSFDNKPDKYCMIVVKYNAVKSGIYLSLLSNSRICVKIIRSLVIIINISGDLVIRTLLEVMAKC